MGILDRIVVRFVAGIAVTLTTIAIVGLGYQAGFGPRSAANPSSAPRIPQAAPTPSYVPPRGSRCAPAIDGAPYDWTAVVCPAADQLTAARGEFDALVKDSDGQDWIGAYADAALLSQRLKALELSVEHAPNWKKGASILTSIRSAIDSYRDGVDRLNLAAQTHDKKGVPSGKKLIAAGHKSFASAVHALRALAAPPASGSAGPSASSRPSASSTPAATSSGTTSAP